jgi:hypothetical protein
MIDRLLLLSILKTEKIRVCDRFISYSKYSRRGIIHSEKSGICSDGNRKLGFLKSVFYFFFITLERSKTRQDKFESILEIIESVVSSPFVKAETDSVEYFVLCLKRSLVL